ncbi:receptor-like protein 15 [Cornus florida]|uniref:receptor-like protein 15 n=1 Tax=Cornus florida TaxID=4283 RepID=UPI0028964AD3|nr:receptor-like protein 15 [Cornus florida]
MELSGGVLSSSILLMLVLVNGCWEQERIALLELKASINHPNGSSLPSWEGEGTTDDCCECEGVECNTTTLRVIKLSLNFTREYGLRDCASSNISSTTDFPNFLYYQKDLQIVELSQINFDGKFPNWLLENNTGLGHIPRNIGTAFPGLMSLTMSGNRFAGNIPSSFGYMSSLQTLDLSNNQLSGGIPEQLARGCVASTFLKLFHNNLQGPILPTKNIVTVLEILFLDHNLFAEISDSLSNSPSLEVQA